MGYVIFREDPNTHDEVYLETLLTGHCDLIGSVEQPEEALVFDTAAQAYEWAGQQSPLLDNWRVGLR